MSSGIFYRNIRARDQLELFLVAAISSVLLVRLYLYLTGYPQVGNSQLHIAHMLWGGLLMLVAVVLSLSFLGARMQRLVAVIGGAGFGVFIDELGKFITHNNNYFYQPTIGLIYAIFIILYLTFNFLGRKHQRVSSREYQLNALAQLEEAVLSDMDRNEKAQVSKLLSRADPDDPVTRSLERFLHSIDTIPVKQPNRFRRFFYGLDRRYGAFWAKRTSNTLVRTFFLLEALFFVASVVAVISNNIDSALDIFSHAVPFSVQGQLLSSIAAAAYALYGAVLLPTSRVRAYEQFRRATLVNLCLTEFFMFSRIQFGALPGLVLNLVVLTCLNYVIRLEARTPQPDQA